jgi:Putative MetA-pathway of phenol degradation
MQFQRQTIILIICSVIVLSAQAQETSAGSKEKYTIFKPVPLSLMRELTPDRPDKTESPYTLDAGHFSLEMDFANYTYAKSDGITSRAWNIAPLNLKCGLSNTIDVQIVFDDYLHVRTQNHLSGLLATQAGVGDLTARIKINLWGDDRGRTAFGILPYVKIPTNTGHLGNGAIEGGVICPFAFKAPGDFDAGMETAIGLMRDDEDNDYHEDFINSITLDHEIIGTLSGYMEFFTEIGTERQAGWVGTFDAGLEYLVGKNAQFDCGCNFGVTTAADEFNPFAGITVRF